MIRLTEIPFNIVKDASVPPKYRKRTGGVVVNAYKSMSYRKPGLMVILTCSVVLGVVLSSVAQAAEVPKNTHERFSSLQQFGIDLLSGGWLESFADLDLAVRMKNWRPRIEVDHGGDGLRIFHPFGGHGPALKFSTSIPGYAKYSLRAGGDSQIGSMGDRTDGYIFLQRRW